MGSIQYVKLHINSPREELFGLLFFFSFWVFVRSVHALPGFVDTAVGMHDGVLDEVDAGSGGDNGIEGWRKRDGGISRATGGAW